MVTRGAGAAGPVLLACRQWDPLGLARRLPSLGAGAWRCAPLLPWRVQCPVCVCAALAARSGGSGRYLVLCLSRFPLPAPRVPRCVWRAVPSGCPLPSLAGTPFHTFCAFRALGPVALLVVPACPFRVCALALPRCPLPSPLGGVACAPPVVPALGAGRAVPTGPCPSVCPAPVPRSVWRAWGGAVRSRFPPTWLGVVGVAVGRPRGGCLLLLRGASEVRRSPSPDCPPTGRAVGVRDPRIVGAGVRVWGPFSVPSAGTPCGCRAPRGGSVAFVCWGGGPGGGGRARRTPRLCGRGGPVGRGVALPHSVPLPSLGRQQSGCHWRCAVHGGRGPPYRFGSCSPGFSGCDLCGVLARWRGLACSSRPPREPAAGAGGRVALWLLSRAGGGPSPLPRGVGAGAPAACGLVGGRGGGVSRRGLPAPFLGGGLRYSIQAPFVSSARFPPACACGRGRSAAPELGGVRGGPWTAPPGALADLNPPSALPEWAVWSCGSCGSCGARPPILFCRARCSGTPLWARGSRSSRRSTHRVAVPSGGGGVPSAPEGRRAAPVAPQLGGVRGGGGGGAAPPPALGPEWEGGGGGGGGLSGPLATPPDGQKGGAVWQSRPRGPAIGWGVAPFPRPPLPRAGPPCRPSLGPLIPPAVVARRCPAGGGHVG